MRIWKLIGVASVAAAALALSAASAFAESPPPSAKPSHPPKQPGQAKQPEVSGTIASLAAGQIVLTVKNGSSVTVLTTAATKYEREHQAAASAADLKTGIKVEAKGTANANGTFAAATIEIEDENGAGKPEGAKPKQPKAEGIVSAVSGSRISLSRKDGSTSVVVVSAPTTFAGEHGAAASLADVKVGSRIDASGTTNADGSLTATQVKVKAPKTQ